MSSYSAQLREEQQAVSRAYDRLQCEDVSPYRGVSAWIPSDVASQLLDVAVSVNGGDYEED